MNNNPEVSIQAAEDTFLQAPANGQTLVYNSSNSKWQNGAVTSSVKSTDITDSTAVGRAVLTATDEATACTAIKVNDVAWTVTNGYWLSQAVVSPNAQTGNYTLTINDFGEAVEIISSSATTITVPSNSAVASPIGTVLEVARCGTGQVQLAAGSGVTLQTPASLMTRAQYSTLTLRKRATDVWLVGRDMQ